MKQTFRLIFRRSHGVESSGDAQPDYQQQNNHGGNSERAQAASAAGSDRRSKRRSNRRRAHVRNGRGWRRVHRR